MAQYPFVTKNFHCFRNSRALSWLFDRAFVLMIGQSFRIVVQWKRYQSPVRLMGRLLQWYESSVKFLNTKVMPNVDHESAALKKIHSFRNAPLWTDTFPLWLCIAIISWCFFSFFVRIMVTFNKYVMCKLRRISFS